MDPVTLAILLTLFVLAAGGSAKAIKKQKEQKERLRLRDSLRTHRRLEDQRISLFDVFWDLGASGFALELMAHHDLLPRDEAQTHGAWSRLTDLIAQHGNYEAFLEDSLEAFAEFYEEQRFAPNRRLLPGLTEASSRTIPIPVSHRLESDQGPARPSAPSPGAVPTAAAVRERRELRAGRQDPGLAMERTHEEVDLDHVGDFSAMSILESVFDGDLGLKLGKWWKMRRLRQKKQDLDRALEEFYDFYAATAHRHPNFYDPLYDAHLRWRDEASRLRMFLKERPWKDRPFALTADVLVEEAVAFSEHLASRAYQSTYRAIETIHDYARASKKPMAGYLVFLNRHAFFAGRHPAYADYARKVEFATQHVREEIIALRNEGLI